MLPLSKEHPYKEECKTGRRNGYTAERPATVKVNDGEEINTELCRLVPARKKR